MKCDHISDAMNLLPDDIIHETEEVRAQKKHRHNSWLKWVAATACLCLIIFGVVQLRASLSTSLTLSGGVYAQVIEVVGTEFCKVEVTGEDENFAQGDIIHVNYSAVRMDEKEVDTPLEVGNLVAISYNGVKKVGNDYEVTVPYVEILTFPNNEIEKTEYNKHIYEIEPFEIQFQLPENWSTGDYDPETVNYLYQGVWSRVGVYDTNGNCVGAIGYNIYDADEYVAGEPMSIYHQIALGNNYQFNVHETYTIVKETDQYQTATVDVYYAPNFLDGIGEDGITNYGILIYAIDQTVYAAFEFDCEALTDEQVKEIANSICFLK